MSGRLLFWLLAVIGAIVDLATKVIAFRIIGEGDPPRTIISGFLNLSRSINYGGVFGMMQGWSFLLAILSLVAFSVIVLFAYRAPKEDRLTPIALGLVGAGAIGNFYDRIFIGGVRDFIDVNIFGYPWPTFNIADAFICVGAALIFIAAIRQESRERSAKQAKAKKGN